MSDNAVGLALIMGIFYILPLALAGWIVWHGT